MPETISSHLGISIIKDQTIASGAASVASAAFVQATRMARLCATQDIFYAVGAAPVAGTSMKVPLPAGVVEYVAVKPGWKIAVMQSVVAGSVNIAECE